MKLTSTHLSELASVTTENILKRLTYLYGHKKTNKDGSLPRPTPELAEAIHERLNYWKEALGDVLNIHKGIQLIPLHDVSSGTCSCKTDDCRSAGKHPRSGSWQRSAGGSTSIEAMTKWLYVFGLNINVGVKTGTIQRGVVHKGTNERTGKEYHRAEGYEYLYVFDLDSSDASRHAEVLEMLGQPTYLVLTQSGGLHIYFKTTKSLKNSVKSFAEDMDARGHKGLVVAPGSRGMKGFYRTDRGNDWFNETVPFLAQSTVDMCKAMPKPRKEKPSSAPSNMDADGSKPAQSNAKPAARVRTLTPEQRRWTEMPANKIVAMHGEIESFTIPEGVRNSVALKVGRFLRGCRAYTKEQIIDYLTDLRLHRFDKADAYSDKEIEKIAAWCATKEPNDSTNAYVARPDYINKQDSGAFFSCIKTSDRFLVPLMVVAERYQAFLEARGYKFRKKIDINAIARHLKDLGKGFDRTKARLDNGTGKKAKALNYWNIDITSLPPPLSLSTLTMEGTMSGEENRSQVHELSLNPFSPPHRPSIIKGTSLMGEGGTLPSLCSTIEGTSTPTGKKGTVDSEFNQEIWEERQRHRESERRVQALVDEVGWDAVLDRMFHPTATTAHSSSPLL